MDFTGLRELRIHRDITQEELAEKAGVHKATVQRMESGEAKDVRVSTLWLISKVLDVKMEEVIYRS